MNIAQRKEEQQKQKQLTIEKALTFSMNELFAFHQSRYVVKRGGITAEDVKAGKEAEEQLQALFKQFKVVQVKNPKRNKERKEYKLARITLGKKTAKVLKSLIQ